MRLQIYLKKLRFPLRNRQFFERQDDAPTVNNFLEIKIFSKKIAIMVNSRMFFTNFTFEFPKSALTEVWAAGKSLGRAEIRYEGRGIETISISSKNEYF